VIANAEHPAGKEVITKTGSLIYLPTGSQFKTSGGEMKTASKLFVLIALIAIVISVVSCASPTPVTVKETVIVAGTPKVVEKTVVVQQTVAVPQTVVVTLPTPTATPNPNAPVTVPCDFPAPASAQNVSVIGWTFPIMDYYANEMKQCNNVKNVKVDVKLLDSASAQQQVRTALAGGAKSPYAIVHGANDQVVAWSSQGWMRPLDDLVKKYWDKYDLGDIPQSAWDGATVDGKIYGVPITANTLMLFYRPDLFDKYKLQVPTTYDEVIAACKVLKAENTIDLPFTINLHAGWAWDYEFLPFIRAYGGDYLNPDNTPAFNSPAGVAALTKMKEVVDACMGPKGLTYSIDQSETALENGRLAFAQIWASRAANMDDPTKSKFVGKINFAPAAAPKAGGPLGGTVWNDFYMIPAKSDVDPEVAFQIIMEATKLDAQKQAGKLGMITRTKVGAAGIGGRYFPAANTTIAKGAGSYQKVPANSLALTALANWLPLVATGELTPKDALDKAAADYTKEAKAQGFIK
jgi:sorbitol/mannitol transport system substrate-binding protein